MSREERAEPADIGNVWWGRGSGKLLVHPKWAAIILFPEFSDFKRKKPEIEFSNFKVLANS